MPQLKKSGGAARDAREFREPKGMHDVLPAEQPWWDRIEKVLRELADFYNFSRIDPPVVEYAQLYQKGTGEETDIVQKEMYTFRTRGGDVLALRPEFTPGIMRSYLEHNLARTGQPQKLTHFGPVFRHDNPQAHRYRQFVQAGFDIIGGGSDAMYDAQVIIIAQHLLEELKIKDIILRINSVGCRVCRPLYKKQLQNYYRNHEKELCKDCQERLKTNPLRLFDCKNNDCQKLKEHAPNFLDRLCVSCSNHLKTVFEYLEEVKVPYVLDNQLVRGLDYYSKTVFEFYVEGKGADVGALPAGGRYDYLAEMIGGRSTPAVGFSTGIERLIAVMKLQGVTLPARAGRRIFVTHAGDTAKKKAFKLIEELRRAGFSVTEALARESLKAQLKAADRDRASAAIILGQKEIYEGSVILRNLQTGLQETFPVSRMVEELKKWLK